MTDVVCPQCTAKAGRPDNSGLFKEFKDGLCWLSCHNCGWKTEPFAHHGDIKLPTEAELRENWK